MTMRFGAAFWVQRTTWPELRAAVLHAEAAGFDDLWIDDHLLSDEGAWRAPKLEGWTTLAAIAAVREGVTAGQVDRKARQVLGSDGLRDAFVHSTGHGLGLEIHEPPRIGRRDKTRLQAGMVITIEPGVYLEGFGGIRIEDTVLVTKTGCEVLTPTPKELILV